VLNLVSHPILELSADGLYCRAGDFHIDPWNPVTRAVVTHSHSDHARPGNGTYLTTAVGARVLRSRLGADANIETLPYGEVRVTNGVRLSLHPAGHVLGSAQVRVEYRGEVWVVSGDYKLAQDPTCAAFEPVRCHTFITESTFGLPIYRWPEERQAFDEIDGWWRKNQSAGKASVIFAYSLGKAQRVLSGIDSTIGPVFAHGAVRNLNRCYRESGVSLPETGAPDQVERGYDWSRALVIAPPSAQGSTWMRRFGPVSTGFASGWMRIRGTRRRRSIDRGFVLSDHADWQGLLEAIRLSEAECVWVTHGYRAPLARWITEHGREAKVVETRWEDDELAEDTGAQKAGEQKES
jgi:putative mRNA 3-end processing factor